MASASIRARYEVLIKRLFPTGWAWNFGPIFRQLISALAYEPTRLEERALDFLNEVDPYTTFEMLDNWERMLGIPDECTPDGDPSLYERRVRIIQKLTTGGGQSIPFFELIAQQLGYDVDIIDVENFQDFRAGYGRAGDPLSNNSGGWAYAFQVKAPADLVRYFRAGQSTAGERLVLFSNDTLECVIRKFAPAHVTVLFNYGA